MRLAVDDSGAVPVYEQLRSQIAGAVIAGELGDGERLPSARALAEELEIAVNTVMRAYRELSDAGLIISRRRYGTTVVGGAAVPADVAAAATRLALRAQAAGVEPERVVDLMRYTMADTATS